MPDFVFVTKVSKFCNLRCLYCYEHRELHVRDVMAFSTLANLFRGVDTFGDHLARDGIAPTFSFVWHGGEPLLLPGAFYERIVALQKSLICKFPYRNSVQTNLTGGTRAALDFVRKSGWGLGVSIDFAPDVRRNVGGHDSNGAVIAAAEALHQAGAAFGVITVLGSHNRHAMAKAYDWVAEFANGWRILPLFDGGLEAEMQRLRLAPEEVAEVFREILDHRSLAARHIPVNPLDEYIKWAALRILGQTSRDGDFRESLDNIYVVNVNGDVFTRPFAYDDAYRLGNINDSTIPELLATERYRKCQGAILRRKTDNCPACEFLGACDSSPMHEHGAVIAAGGRECCGVPQAALRAIEAELLEAGVDQAVIADWARSWLAGGPAGDAVRF